MFVVSTPEWGREDGVLRRLSLERRVTAWTQWTHLGRRADAAKRATRSTLCSAPSASASASLVCVRSTTTSARLTDGGHATPQPRRKSGTYAKRLAPLCDHVSVVCLGPISRVYISRVHMRLRHRPAIHGFARLDQEQLVEEREGLGAWIVQARVRPRSAKRRSAATT